MLIPWQPLFRFTRDRRQGEIPAQAKGAVAGAGVIRERKLWTKARATWAGGNGHSHGAGAGDRVGTEFFTDAPHRAPTFRKRNGGDAYLVVARLVLFVLV